MQIRAETVLQKKRPISASRVASGGGGGGTQIKVQAGLTRDSYARRAGWRVRDAAVCTVQFAAAMYTIAIYQITFGPDLCSGMRVLMALRLKEPLLIQETPLPQNYATNEWQNKYRVALKGSSQVV